MSESTRTSADGGEPDTLNVEELFATDDTDISIDDGESTDGTDTPATETVAPEPEDTTAGELFQQLRDEHDDGSASNTVDELTDESPEAIMARADEPAEHVDPLDDAIRADEGALDDLLLTERREADGFLWIETDDDATANEGVDDLGSLLEHSDTADAPTSTTEASTHDEPEVDDATSDDGFALSTDEPASFDARAATFDDAAFRGDDATDESPTTDDGEDAGADEATKADASTEAAADAGTEAAVDGDETPDGDDATDDDATDDDGGGGLAARIRSILSG
jgi:hypothetical protein